MEWHRWYLDERVRIQAMHRIEPYDPKVGPRLAPDDGLTPDAVRPYKPTVVASEVPAHFAPYNAIVEVSGLDPHESRYYLVVFA